MEMQDEYRRRIQANLSYVERDFWEWEAAVTDEERLQEMLDTLP